MIDEHELIRDEVAAHALGALDGDARDRLEAHLTGCAECRRLLAEYRQAADHLPFLLPVEPPPAGAWEGIAARIHRAPAAEAGDIAAVAQRPGGAARFWPWLPGGWDRLLPALAGAAVLALVSLLVVVLLVRGAGNDRSAKSGNGATVRHANTANTTLAPAAASAAAPPSATPPSSAAVGSSATPAGSGSGAAASATAPVSTATATAGAAGAAVTRAATPAAAVPPAATPSRVAIAARTATPAAAPRSAPIARAPTAQAAPSTTPATGDDFSGLAFGAALAGLLLAVAGTLLLRRLAGNPSPPREPKHGQR